MVLDHLIIYIQHA